jgi:hypothetical protein
MSSAGAAAFVRWLHHAMNCSGSRSLCSTAVIRLLLITVAKQQKQVYLGYPLVTYARVCGILSIVVKYVSE